MGKPGTLPAAALTLSMMPAIGAAETWDNSSGDGQWSNASNWLDDSEPDGSQACTFPGVIIGSSVITLSPEELADSLYFANNYTLTGGALTLAGAGGPTIVTPAGVALATINSDLAGTAGLHKTETGWLTLGGNNTFTGLVRVDGGRLVIDADARLGNAANTVELNSSMLELVGGIEINRAITLNTGTVFATLRSSQGVATSLGMLTLGPNNAVQLATTFPGDELNIGLRTSSDSVPITGGADTIVGIQGPGVVRLGGQSSSYAGQWAISNGTLDVGRDARLGGPSNEVTLSGGTILFDGVSETMLRPLTVFSGGIRINGAAQTLAGPFTTTGTLAKTGQGVLRIFGSQSHLGGSQINVNEGTVILFSAAGNTSAHPLRINVNAGALFQTSVTNFLGFLDVDNAGVARVAIETSGGGVLLVERLRITGSGQVDLLSHKLIVRALTADLGTWNGATYTGLTGLVASGRGGGAWNGGGIVTTMSDAIGPGALTTLGVAMAGAVGKSSFGGVSVAADDVLVMYTYGGDANLDGKINVDDYGRIDGNVASSGSVFGWSNGDFNYDGKINIDDYGIIDGNINRQGVPFSAGEGVVNSVAAVPEPGGAVMLPLACLVLSRRRRR